MQPAARGPAAARRPSARAPTARATDRAAVAKGFGTEGPPAPSGGGDGAPGRGPSGGGERTVGFRGDSSGRGPLEGLSPARSPGSPAIAERLRALDAVLALEEALDAGDDDAAPGSLSNHDWSRGPGAAVYADPAAFDAFDEADYVAKQQPGLLISGMSDAQFGVFLALILPPVFLLPFSIVSAAHGGPDGAFHALQEALSFAFAYKPLDL